MDPRLLYVEHLDIINRISDSLCRLHGIRGADAEDFAAEVRLKLLEDDYARLRKYRGDSSMTTFLTVVITNQFRDHRVKLWGKWRPSAEAKRRGQAAVLLEAAVYRDGQSFEQACSFLAQDVRLTVDRAELRKVMAELPRRVPRRVDDGASVDDVPSSNSADGRVLDHERDERIKAAKAALDRAVGRLDPEDRLIIRLHFFEGMSLAQIARALGIEQKPLYPRLKRLLEQLSATLTSEGIGPEHVDWLNSGSP